MKSAAETVSYITATKVGELLSPKLKPAEVNQALKEAGLHTVDADGVWRLTERGKEVGVFIKIGNGGMNKWSPSVAAMLGANPDKPATAPAKKKKGLGVFGKTKKKVL